MKVVSEADEHLISVQDDVSGALWHFAAGQTRGVRFVGAQSARPIDPAPDEKSPGFIAAEAAAVDAARHRGWL